ncbi:MAG: hypothetical protein LBG46_03630 [Elusimicrobiota bacterium]|jgi:hypothetical protein|nr:hypothetical protein [Elusimicrobiota bacterium]
MKKLSTFLCLFFICSAYCFSVPYGHLKDFEEDRHLHLIDKIVNNQEITYCSYLSYDTLENISEEQTDEQINLAFKMWTQDIAEFIRQSGREKEFGDIVSILEKKPKLRKLKGCNFSAFDKKRVASLSGPAVENNTAVDISFIYDSNFAKNKYGGDRARTTSYFSVNPIVHIVIDEERDIDFLDIFNIGVLDDEKKDCFSGILSTVEHELGHAIGLADQYDDALGNVDISYSTVSPRKGIMNAEDNFTCDDVDGIITLVDRALGNKTRKFPSFCNDGISFVGSKEEIKERKTYSTDDFDFIGESTDRRLKRHKNNAHNHAMSFEQLKKDTRGFEIEFFKKFPYAREFRCVQTGTYQNDYPIGVWINEMRVDENNKQIVKNIFDDNGKQLSSVLITYEDGKIISEKELPLNYGKNKQKEAVQNGENIKRAVEKGIQDFGNLLKK